MKVTILQPKVLSEVPKKKVCAYARVSTDSNKQEDSLENQTVHYENKIKCNPEYEFVGIFADKGYTGTKDNRPEFQKMMQLCRSGQIDIILTKSIARFARNTTIILEYVRELKLLGVEVQFEKENLKTLTKDSEFMLSVLSSFAEEESRSVSDNVKWRIQKKFQKGELIINTKRFLGYDKDEYGELVINQKEAEIVKFIFEEYLSGKGTFTIAKMLNNKGILTVTGCRWGEGTIVNILKNEKYKGAAVLQKYYTKDHLRKQKKRNTGERTQYNIEENHSPIIDEVTWEKVQQEIVRRSKTQGEKLVNAKYPLSGLLFCEKCGAKLKRRTWNSGKECEKVVWQCSNYIANGKQACSGVVIADEVVKEMKITEPTIIKEWMINGEKDDSYTAKSRIK